MTWEYPELTNYQYASDEPIANVDMDGLEKLSSVAKDFSYNYASKTEDAFNFIQKPLESNVTKLPIFQLHSILAATGKTVGLVTNNLLNRKLQIDRGPSDIEKKKSNENNSQNSVSLYQSQGAKDKKYYAGSYRFGIFSAWVKHEHSKAYLDYGVGASGLRLYGDGRLGLANYNVFGSAEGELNSVQANITFGLNFSKNGKNKLGFIGDAEAGAYEAKGEVSGGFTIFGVKMSGTAGGSVLSAHAGIGGGTYYDPSKGSFILDFHENLGFGIGEKLGFHIEIPL